MVVCNVAENFLLLRLNTLDGVRIAVAFRLGRRIWEQLTLVSHVCTDFSTDERQGQSMCGPRSLFAMKTQMIYEA